MNRFNLFVVSVLVFGATSVVSVVEQDITGHKSALMNTNIALINADPYTTDASKHSDVLIDPSRLIDQAELDRGAENKIEDSRDPFFTTESGKLRPRLQKGADADDWANEKPKFAPRQASNAPLSRSKRAAEPIVGCRNGDGGNANRARGRGRASRRGSNVRSDSSGEDGDGDGDGYDDDDGDGYSGYGGGWGGRSNWGGWGSRGGRSGRGNRAQRSRSVSSTGGRRVIVSTGPSTIKVIPQPQQAMIIQQHQQPATVVTGTQQQANSQMVLPAEAQSHTIVQTLPNVSTFNGQAITHQGQVQPSIIQQPQYQHQQPTQTVVQQLYQPGQALSFQQNQSAQNVVHQQYQGGQAFANQLQLQQQFQQQQLQQQ